jgi:hypothetical protein
MLFAKSKHNQIYLQSDNISLVFESSECEGESFIPISLNLVNFIDSFTMVQL